MGGKEVREGEREGQEIKGHTLREGGRAWGQG